MVKHTQTIRRLLPTNYLSVFDHIVGLALKGLKMFPFSFLRLFPSSLVRTDAEKIDDTVNKKYTGRNS